MTRRGCRILTESSLTKSPQQTLRAGNYSSATRRAQTHRFLYGNPVRASPSSRVCCPTQLLFFLGCGFKRLDELVWHRHAGQCDGATGGCGWSSNDGKYFAEGALAALLLGCGLPHLVTGLACAHLVVQDQDDLETKPLTAEGAQGAVLTATVVGINPAPDPQGMSIEAS